MSSTAPITEGASSKAINAKIGNIKRSVASLKTTVQQTALLIVSHAEAFGDCTAAARLLEALGETSRRRLLQDWFKMCSPIAVVPDEKSGKGKFRAHLRKVESKDYQPFNRAIGEATPWFDVPAAANDPELMTAEDFMEGFTRFMDRWNKMLNPEAGTEPKKTIADGDKNVVRDGLAKLAALKLTVKAG